MHRKRPLIPKNLSQRCTCTFSTVPHVFKSPLAPSKSHSKYVYENRTESRTSVAAFQFYRTRSMTLLPDRRDLEPKNRPLPDHAQLPVNEPIINFKKNDTGEGGAVNQKKGMSEEPYEANLRGRTVSLTPWKGAPTFLHAVAFVRELEKRYGKIEWCGISRHNINPYEYRPHILVIFESPDSLRKMPGFAFAPPPTIEENSLDPSPSGTFDMGPSTSLDPTSSPSTQAMLRRIQAESSSASAKRQGSRNDDPTSISPLFMPWSEKLDEAAVRKGGPALEDVLSFLGEENRGEKGKGGAKESQKASWEEYDEAINIDAVVRKWDLDTLWLPNAPAPPRPFFRQDTRLRVAQAFVDFGGFAEQRAPKMQAVVQSWREEIEGSKREKWIPYEEQTLAETVASELAEAQESPNDTTQDEADWEALSFDTWLAEQYDLQYGSPQEAEGLVYERTEDVLDLEESTEADGNMDMHYANMDSSSISMLERPSSKESQLADVESRPSSSSSSPSQRTDPHGSFGEHMPSTANPDSILPATHRRLRPQKWQYYNTSFSKNVAASPQNGMPASHSIPSQDFAKDMRGKKMKARDVIKRSREEADALARYGLGDVDKRAAERTEIIEGGKNQPEEAIGWEEADLDRMEQMMKARAMEQERSKKEKDLKARLRAILDGTNI